jgi:hypothetical protein
MNGAMVVIRHDVDDEHVHEYLRWHTFEHLPERLALPGFEAAERYERIDGGGPRFLCVIDVASPGDLESPEYVERLNAPTDWTRRLMPHYCNVQRVLCETIADVGSGHAPLLLCMHFKSTSLDISKLASLIDTPLPKRDITRIRVGRALDAVTRRPSEEGRIRGADESGAFPYFLCAGLLHADAAGKVTQALSLTSNDYEQAIHTFSYAASAD